MNKLVLNIASCILLAILIFIILIAHRENENQRRQLTCSGIKVEFTNSYRFTTAGEIKADVDKNYGKYIGQRIEEMNLTLIERILETKSIVKKCDAYCTSSGVLNLRITQRKPLLRLQCERFGLYADEDGFIFPLQSKFTCRVPVVDGNIPIKLVKTFKGQLKDKNERLWLTRIIDLISYMDNSSTWKNLIGQIRTESDGSIILIPSIGHEKFIFGQPTDIENKLNRLKDYYKYVPKEKKQTYSTVDVRYKDQLVCR